MTLHLLINGTLQTAEFAPDTPLNNAAGMYLARHFPGFEFPQGWPGLEDSDGVSLEPRQPVRELCDFAVVVVN